MRSMKEIIIDNTLKRIDHENLEQYVCHAYCRQGFCTFKYNSKRFKLEAGDCLIMNQRGGNVKNIEDSDDLVMDAIYVTVGFVTVCSPQNNYATKGHLSLFDNPIMKLTPEMQKVCEENFSRIKWRVAHTSHDFYRDALINAIQCMIIDFFDFHAKLYGMSDISSQNSRLMDDFVTMLERGDYQQNRDIGYYADKLCVTPKHLSEVSKKVSGFPANYWIIRYTSISISRLLRDRNLSFTEISDMFGFSSLSHFNRYVQNYLGAKPSDFRE